jgi:hypothetical protein
MSLVMTVVVYIVGAIALVTVSILVYHAISDWFKGLDEIPKSDNHGQAD